MSLLFFHFLQSKSWGVRCKFGMKSVRYLGKKERKDACCLCSLIVQPFWYYELFWCEYRSFFVFEEVITG